MKPKSRLFYHIVLLTDVSGWEGILEILDEPSAEIWYHPDGAVPHYHAVVHSDKLRNAAMVRKALGCFGGIRVEALSDSYAYRQALAYARSRGERYVGQ